MFGDGKSKAAMPPEQLWSLAVQGSRRNVAPELSERRSAHVPPTITVFGPSMCRCVSGSVNPVDTPAQVWPASPLRINVPKSPDAKPTGPENSTADSVCACGAGLPQNQPE